jgi:threonine/homoserine/homoserine lactone efflux protein
MITGLLDLGLPVFISAAICLAATPGTGTLYVLARTLRGGWREGVATVVGTTTGGLVQVLVATFGGAVVLGQNESRVRVASIVGALYLSYLGVLGLRSQLTMGLANSRGKAFKEGLLVAVLNPTTAIFLCAFLPQFIDPSGHALMQFLALGVVTVLFNALAHLTWAALGANFGGRVLQCPTVRVVLQRVSGGLLVAIAAYSLVRAV